MKMLVAVLVLVLGLIAGKVQAQTAPGLGYMCLTGYVPNAPEAPGTGTYGYGLVTLYSGPSCSGNFLAGGYVCSEGATSAQCNPSYLYDQTSLLAVIRSLEAAALANTRVFIGWDVKNRFEYALFYGAGY
jgi:hypothetical protein